MRQLGRHQLEQHPARARPDQQKAHRRLRATPDRGQEARQQEQGRRPEGQIDQRQEIARRRPVRFLSACQLGREIVPQRLLIELAMALQPDGDEPRQHQRQGERQSHERPGAAEPAAVAIPQRQDERRDGAHRDDDRPLDQNADGERRPAGQRQSAADRRPLRPRGHVNAQQEPLRPQHAGQQHGVGRGDGRLGAKQQRACQKRGGQQGDLGARESLRAPEGEPDGGDGADQRRQSIGPDTIALAQAGDFRGRGLEPIDADGLLIAGHRAEADVDVVAALQHLLGGLGETALVAVEGRQDEHAGRPQRQAEQQQRQSRPARQPVQQLRQTPRRLGRFAHVERLLYRRD